MSSNDISNLIKKRARSSKLTKEQSDNKIQEIYDVLIKHVNKPVILLEKENRDMVPYFVHLQKLKNQKGSLVALQKCYGPDGKFRCYITHSVDIIKILIGEQKLVFFNDEI